MGLRCTELRCVPAGRGLRDAGRGLRDAGRSLRDAGWGAEWAELLGLGKLHCGLTEVLSRLRVRYHMHPSHGKMKTRRLWLSRGEGLTTVLENKLWSES